ncbi:hypothetical protein ADK61_22415 [Streptomyces sp. XY66]|uniref:hypothetical protein n=1 Tax=Streptomyces sp. XY66 TaxID=1415563 RepID=UPI0006AE706E|nr:hypothetical protein [Streptomyces sp. XY66]KOU73741.1 hypothetical protein ADK61_22415 [Streptomyces sp. XY66]
MITSPRPRRIDRDVFHEGEEPQRTYPGDVRRWATGEPYRLASEECQEGLLIPTAVETQAMGEALLLDALLSEYGLHRPALTGGPFGIILVTPRTHEILIRVAPRQLLRWAATVLRTVARGADLLWSAEEHGIALTLAGARVVLLATAESDWRAAIDQTEHSAYQPGSVQAQDGRTAYLAPIVPLLSATLRRVHLLTDPEVSSPTVELLIAEHRGEPCLYDTTGGAPSAIPLWQSVAAPLELWPSAPLYRSAAAVDVRGAISRLMSEADEGLGFPAQDVSEALCKLAGVPAVPLTLRAAEVALSVAEEVLADPRFISLFDGGGWAANRRRDLDIVWVAHTDEAVIPPGAERLVAAFTGDLDMLGMLTLSEEHALTESLTATGELEEDVPAIGQEALIQLLDWALAAATRPEAPWSWCRPDGAKALHANAPTSDPDGVVQLRVEVDSYAVSVVAPSLRENEYVRVWEEGGGPSGAAAILLAESAARTAGIAMHYVRDPLKGRLLLPRPVDKRTDLTTAGVILAAHAEAIFDFEDLASMLSRLRYRAHTAGSASEGHWRRDAAVPDDPHDYTHSVLGDVQVWCGTPGTHDGEPANTASPDSLEYRRHLAEHRAAMDPFVTCYLTAAAEVEDAKDFDDRHRAGVTALRNADLEQLADSDPRPVTQRVMTAITALPLDADEIDAWYEAYFEE